MDKKVDLESKVYKPLFFNKSIDSSQDQVIYERLRKMCENMGNNCWDEYYKFGYETFGMILIGYCQWLIKQLQMEKIEKVFFFSRDGYILKEAFQKFEESKNFQVEYIYVSRRSLRVPQIFLKPEKKYDAIVSTTYVSISDLMYSIGLEPINYVDLLKKYDLCLNDVIKDTDIENSRNVSCFIDEIWDDVIRNSKKEYTFLKGYLSKFDFSGKTAVVDIGWRGSMQLFLNNLLQHMDINCELYGYYITLTSTMVKGLNMKGYYGNVSGNGTGCDSLRGYTGLIETLFLKTEGSTKKYNYDGRNYTYELEEYEYSDKDEYASELESVKQIQEGALKFVNDFIKTNNDKTIISYQCAFYNLSRFANYPTLHNVKMFGNFRFNNGSITYLAKAQPFYKYIFNLKKLKSDLYGCRWRVGFLKDLFKIPFPYYSLFEFLMKLAFSLSERE